MDDCAGTLAHAAGLNMASNPSALAEAILWAKVLEELLPLPLPHEDDGDYDYYFYNYYDY